MVAVARVRIDCEIKFPIRIEISDHGVVDRIAKQRCSPTRRKTGVATPVNVAGQIFAGQFATMLRRKDVQVAISIEIGNGSTQGREAWEPLGIPRPITRLTSPENDIAHVPVAG